jgi:hypothetical protein
MMSTAFSKHLLQEPSFSSLKVLQTVNRCLCGRAAPPILSAGVPGGKGRDRTLKDKEVLFLSPMIAILAF